MAKLLLNLTGTILQESDKMDYRINFVLSICLLCTTGFRRLAFLYSSRRSRILSTEENKLIVRRYYEEVVNTGNVDLTAEFISPDYVEVYNNIRHPIGLEGAKEHVLGVRQTYPDLHLTIEQQIAEGEWVVTRVTMRGTHAGVWLGMKPTGKKVEMTAVNIDRVVDGCIVEHGGAANILEPLLEIGAIRIADPIEG